jgi:hypothetical protein
MHRNVQEVLGDPKWRTAMQEYMKALKKKKKRHEILLTYLMGRRVLDASECSLSSIRPVIM